MKNDYIMKLKQLGSNQTLIQFSNGNEVFFSYETPVAGYDASRGVYERTSEYYSRTTSRHINNYLDGVKAVDMHQDHFDKFFG